MERRVTDLRFCNADQCGGQGRARACLTIVLRRLRIDGIKKTLAEPVTPHGMPAGFVTAGYCNGVPDEELMGHTRRRILTEARSYLRRTKVN
jgi:hypothetical protein